MIPVKEAQEQKQERPQTRTTTLDESKYSDHYYHCIQNNGEERQLDYQHDCALDASGSNSNQKIVLPAIVVIADVAAATALQVAPVSPSQSAACELDGVTSAGDAAVAMKNNGKYGRTGDGNHTHEGKNNNFNNNHSGFRDQIPREKPESWSEEPERASLVVVSGVCVSDYNARSCQQADTLTSLFVRVDKVRREADQLIVESKAAAASSTDGQQEDRQEIKRAPKLLGINLARNLNSPTVDANQSALIKQHQTEPIPMSAAPGLLFVGSAQAAACVEQDFLQFSTDGSSSRQQSMANHIATAPALNGNLMRFDEGFSEEAANKQQKNTNTLLIIEHLMRRRNELKTIDKQLFVMMRQYLMQLDCFQQAAICNYAWPGAEFSNHLVFNSNNAQTSLGSHSQQQHLETTKTAIKQSQQQQEPTWLYHQENPLALIGNSHYSDLASWCDTQPELADVIDLSLVGRYNKIPNCANELPFELALQQQQSQEPLRSASLDSFASLPLAGTNVPVKETRAPSVNLKKTRLLGASRQEANLPTTNEQQRLELDLRPATNDGKCQQRQQKQSENLSICSSSHSPGKPDQTSSMDFLKKLNEHSNSNDNQSGNHNEHDTKNEEQQFRLQLQQQLTVATVDGIDGAKCSTFDSTMDVADAQAAIRSSSLNISNNSPLPSLYVAIGSSQQKLMMTSADKLVATTNVVLADHDDVDAGPVRKKFRSWQQTTREQQQAGKPGTYISNSMADSLDTNNFELIYELHQQQQQQLLSQYLGQHHRSVSLSPMHLLSVGGAPSDTNHLIYGGRLGDRVQFNPSGSGTSADYQINSTAAVAATTACLLDRHDNSLACRQNSPLSNHHHLHNQSTVADGLHSTTTSIAPARQIAIQQVGQQQLAIAPTVRASVGQPRQQLVQTRVFQRRIAYRCHVCGSGFEDRHRLQQHLSIHLNLHPSWFEERTITETMAQYESKRGDYLCGTCNLRFDTTAEFDRHMHLHGDKPHRCEFCNQDNKLVSFRYHRQLLTHLRSHCFLYSCRFAPDCKQTANRKDYLKLHILKHHLNNKLPEQYTFCCH